MNTTIASLVGGIAPAAQDAAKLVPVISAAAVFAAAEVTRRGRSPMGEDKVSIESPAYVNANIFRWGKGSSYGITGYYNSAWIGVNINQAGGENAPIFVSGRLDRPLNMSIHKTGESYHVTGSVEQQPVNLTIFPSGDKGSFVVSGIVGTNFVSTFLSGTTSPSARYTLIGPGTSLNINERGTDGSEYTIGGVIGR